MPAVNYMLGVSFEGSDPGWIRSGGGQDANRRHGAQVCAGVRSGLVHEASRNISG